MWFNFKRGSTEMYHISYQVGLQIWRMFLKMDHVPICNLQLEIEKWACKSLSKSSSSQLPNAQETLWVVFFIMEEYLNPTIFNIIHWVAELIGRSSQGSSSDVPSTIFFHNFLQNYLQKSFQFFFTYSRLWNRRSPWNKHSPWNIWQKH